MALLRTNETNFPGRLSDVLDQFFEEANRSSNGGSFVPSVDLSETDKSYEVETHLPGMKKDDINVEVDGNTLKITGEKQRNKEDKEKAFHRIESEYGHFRRELQIPEDGDFESIEAKYENGVLHLSIPKSKKKENTKKIDIK